MEDRGLDCLVVYGNRASHDEIQYLANNAIAFEGALVFPLQADPVLLVHYRNHVPTTQRVSRVADVRWGGDDIGAGAAATLRQMGLERARIGVAGPIPHRRWASLEAGLPDASLSDCQPGLSALRLVKSEEEIAWIRRGAHFSDLAIEALESQAEAGLDEHQLAALVEGAYYALGGRTHIHYIGTTSMRKPDLCVPAQMQSRRRLEPGDVILTELSAAYHGYWGQVLRTFTVGRPPTREYARMHQVALDAFTAVTGVLREGATSDQVMDAAELIHRAGYTIYDDLVHFAVGGVYAPYLRTRRTTEGSPPQVAYREDMVVVVQPNVVSHDGRMGVQVGEMVRITREGVDRLHGVPLRLLRCG
jgi:Xaa-Pro aminopeptidase